MNKIESCINQTMTWFGLYRILFYSGFGLDRIPFYSGFGLDRIPFYSGFSFKPNPE
jgi:hypothetical protein